MWYRWTGRSFDAVCQTNYSSAKLTLEAFIAPPPSVRQTSGQCTITNKTAKYHHTTAFKQPQNKHVLWHKPSDALSY